MRPVLRAISAARLIASDGPALFILSDCRSSYCDRPNCEIFPGALSKTFLSDRFTPATLYEGNLGYTTRGQRPSGEVTSSITPHTMTFCIQPIRRLLLKLLHTRRRPTALMLDPYLATDWRRGAGSGF
jgi:hypothetical protein